ncbi:MAG: hypothetical protein ABIH89_00940 [Elusimicrobiota bacterium]
MKKILIFSSRIPEYKSIKAGNYLAIMKILAERYDVHFLTFQSLFVDKRTIGKIGDLGVKVVSLKDKKDGASFDAKMKKFLSIGYEMILFDSIYTAKYYLSFIYMYSPESKLIMDARHSQYLLELKFSAHNSDQAKEVSLLEKSRISAEKEVPIYNYFDKIIIEDEAQQAVFNKDIPNAEVVVFPEKSAKIEWEDIKDIFLCEEKRILPDKQCGDMLDISKINYSDEEYIIADYNSLIKKSRKDYILILLKNTVVPAGFINRLVFCMQSHPDNCMVLPISNHGVISATNSLIPCPEEEYYFAEFLKKHFIGNFAEWRRRSFIGEPSFLVKKDLFSQIGYLDTRFRTLGYALYDLSYRILQAGRRIILNQEAFIFYNDFSGFRNKSIRSDHRYLVEKWGKTGAEILELLGDPDRDIPEAGKG